MKYQYKHTPELIVLLYLFIFMGFKSPEKSWDRIITSDGKGYYAYLPAIFIYHDLGFGFIDQYEYQYYTNDQSGGKEFCNEVNGRKVNKYFPGLAIIWLPFFLLGHAFAWLEIFPRDGYSLPYQLAIAFSAFLFLWLGVRWLLRVLIGFGSSEKQAALVTLTIAFGTNLIYFTVMEPSMTHVYSFALVTGFVYFMQKTFSDYRSRWFVKSLLLLTLIVLIKPTSVLVVLLIPFIAGDKATLGAAFRNIIKDRPALIRGAIQALILISIPFILWYLQAGKPILYSYGSERFDLLGPKFLKILFGYNRGWLLYTPIAFVSLFGFIGLYRENRLRFFWLATFLLVFIYLASTWWLWHYNSRSGQRTFIDIYVVVAFLIMALFRSVQGKKTTQAVLTTLFITLVLLNLVQFYQHARRIFPPHNITSEIYWDSFTTFTKKARVFIPVSGIVSSGVFINDMERDMGSVWMNPATRDDRFRHNGDWSSKTDRHMPYSVGLEVPADTLFTTGNRIVRINAWALSPKEITDATLVVDFQSAGKSLNYNQFPLLKFIRPGKWTPVSVAFYVPADLPDGATMKTYFFNPSPIYDFYIDDLEVVFLSMQDNPEYLKIDGILAPVPLTGE
jgi:hypothetical protein